VKGEKGKGEKGKGEKGKGEKGKGKPGKGALLAEACDEGRRDGAPRTRDGGMRENRIRHWRWLNQ
jgi:hypothetical protein